MLLAYNIQFVIYSCATLDLQKNLARGLSQCSQNVSKHGLTVNTRTHAVSLGHISARKWCGNTGSKSIERSSNFIFSPMTASLASTRSTFGKTCLRFLPRLIAFSFRAGHSLSLTATGKVTWDGIASIVREQFIPAVFALDLTDVLETRGSDSRDNHTVAVSGRKPVKRQPRPFRVTATPPNPLMMAI